MLLIPKILILKSVFPFLAFLVAWEMTWKWIALYKSGQQKEIWRFICIFLFNTFGLLPIIYLLVDSIKEDVDLWSKRNNINKETKQTKKTMKGGVKKWENVMPEKRHKETLKDSWKRKTANTTKK